MAAILTNAGSQATSRRAERLHQLQRDADAREVLVGIGAVVPLRVDHRAASGSSVSGSWWSVMIRSTPSSRARRAASGAADAAVHRHDQLDAFGVQAVDGLGCSP